MRYIKEIPESRHAVLVVCGGGFSGFAAAYSAAKEGVHTLLIEKGGCLGGTGTQGLVNHILGERLYTGKNTYKACVKGLFSELERRLLADGSALSVDEIDLELPPHGWLGGLGVGMIFDNERMKLLLEQMLLEAGVEILYYTSIVDVVKEDDRIAGVIVCGKSGLSVIRGERFIDSTGDGDVSVFAGCSFEKGDENGGMAPASLEMHVENVDAEQLTAYMRETRDFRFKRLINPLIEQGIWKFPYEIFISVMLTRSDVFMINTIQQVGIDGTNTASLTAGTIDGRRENYELLDVMRKYFPGFGNARVRQIAPLIGIRETRRIDCEYALSVRDLIDGTRFPDSIAVSAYGWDLPHPKKPSLQPLHGVKRKSDFTELPYRCLVPKGIGNLLTVGRCIGVERDVSGVMRVMGVCIAMGEAAGIAAALSIANNRPFNKVDTDALRKLIRSRGGITDISQIV